MSSPVSERDVVRALRRLATHGAHRSNEGTAGGAGLGNDRLGDALVEELRRRDLAQGPDGAIALTAAGRALLRRELAGTDPYRRQHLDPVPAVVVADDGSLRHVTIDRSESPLSWLRNRRGRDGRPMIDAVEFAAGERLRADFTRGRMMPRVTANWSAAIASGRRDGGAGGMAELTDAVVSARRRVERALAAVGPELGGLLLDFCCFLKGLEDIEQEHDWPARSAKVVLRLGLSSLARHYGLGAKARGPARSGIVHWGTEDYRPALE